MKKPRLADVVARLLVALLVSSCVFAALFYVYPSRYLFRGVDALAVVLAVCGLLVLRLVFAASNPPKDVRRQLSLELRAPTPKSKNFYLLLFALAAALALLVLLERVP